jgi:vitamin B12 transporter
LKKIFFKYIPAHFGRIFNFRVFVFLMIFTGDLFAGSEISGVVRDTAGKPVSDVNIRLFPTVSGTVSDENGYFYFSRVPDGSYSLIFDHISYITKEIEVNSKAQDEIKLTVSLEASITVLAPVSAEVISDLRSVLTISSRSIEQTNSKNAEEILKSVADINIENTDGSRSRVSIRGTDSKHTSVYLDGVLLNSSMDGTFDLKSIPAEIIDTVEIYKTGDLTQTGSSIGGIIRIKTKKSGILRELKISFSENLYQSDRDEFNYGRLNNHSCGISMKYPFGENSGLFISYTGSRNENEWSYINAAKADEYRYINHPNIPRIQTNAYSYSDNVFASFSSEGKRNDFELGLNFARYESGLPGWYDQPYYSAYSEKRNFTANGRAGFYKKEKLSFDIESSYSFRNDQVNISEIDELFYVDSDDDFQNLKLKAAVKYSLDPFIFRTGAEYNNESVKSVSLDLIERTREIKSVYSKLEYGKNILSDKLDYRLSGAVRKDFISGTDFDRWLFSADNSAEYIWKIFTIIPAYSYSQSYNLPSFSALFWADNLFSSGNPDLKPEFSVQHELSLSGSADFNYIKFKAGYTYYDKKLEDLIVWIKRTNGKYTPENFKEGRITGHEISAGADILDGKLMLDASYSRMNARQFTDNPVTDGKYVIYKPVETFSASLSCEHNDYKASFRAKYNGRMYLNESNSIDIYPFRLYGASVSKNFRIEKIQINIFADCENLSDEQYQVIYGYPMPGRKIGSGIEIKF